MRKFSLYVLSTLLLVIITLPLRAQNVEPTPFPDEIDAALHHLLVEMLIPTDIVDRLFGLSPEFMLLQNPSYEPEYRAAPGAVFYVQSPEGLFFKAIGIENVATREALDPLAHYQIGSTTKSMTAAIVLQLQEEGALSVDDLLSEYLPDLAAAIPNGDQLTILQLLGHTSGMIDYFDDELGEQLVSDMEALQQQWTPTDLVLLAAESDLPVSMPSTSWKYNNTGYVLLGLIIETVTGKPIAEVFQERIFDPLEMIDTYFAEGIPSDEEMPSGYLQIPYDYETTTWNASQAYTAGAVISTVPDMAIYIRGLVTGALFQNSATLELMKTPVIDGSGAGPGLIDLSYGLGLQHYLPGQLWGHAGQTLGFTSVAAHNAETNTTIIVWANSSESMADFVVPAIAQIIGYTPPTVE